MHPLTTYIVENYPHARKVVEVGVGKRREVLEELKERLEGEVVGVDIRGGEVRDDLFSPSLEIYRGAGLIYSLRPEPELYSPLKSLARRVGAELLIVPFSGDGNLNLEGMHLVNFMGMSFYLLKK